MTENYAIKMIVKFLFGFLISNVVLDVFSLIRSLFRLDDQHRLNTSKYERVHLVFVDYWTQAKFQIVGFLVLAAGHLLLLCTNGISSHYWKSLFFCFLVTLVVQLLKRMHSPWRSDDVEVSRYLESDKLNVGSALASSYVNNYLKIVLGNAGLVDVIKDYEMTHGGVTLDTPSDSIPITQVKVDCKKLLILIPASGVASLALLSDNKDNGVTFKDELKSVIKNKDGKSQRSYTNTLYQLTRRVDNKDVYFAGEFATPVSTLIDMRDAGVLTPEQMKEQVRHFYCGLLNLLNKEVEISGTCIPIYYEDSHPGALSEVVLRTIVTDLYRPSPY